MEYLDVLGDGEAMKKMLELSGGKRDVPVIVDGDEVLIGYGGS